ncbi:MAG TPA: zf-HC2 domain-containing protein [Candidatus Angelobacter sp.]|nr:zf-HC2 domain-containing protein [Candidatus Angelobacter sp.]
MRCSEARPLFPLYQDRAVSGAEMHALSDHMGQCAGCQLEYRKLENTRLLVSSLGRKAAPADLALRIRVAVSRERSRSLRSILRSYAVRLENGLNAFMFPATAGIVSAVVFFVVLIGFFVPAQAGADAVAPGLYMPARLQPPQTAISSSADIDLNLEAPVVVQAYVDSGGKVQNYEIISGPDTEDIRSQLNRALLFTSFYPAYAFGQPVPGTAVISFSHVNVKG